MLISTPCYDHWCEIRESGFAVEMLYFLSFLFSLITYRMHDEVFHAWWNFARWMAPVIMLATIGIQFVPSNGGFFNMDGLVYLLVLAPLYTLLIIVSLWKIVRTYIKTKKQ